MTGPIIPADQWPEGAYMHTWDSNGLGNWLRPSYGAWHLWASDIPLPPGHDWRVPVMRQAAPAAVIVTVGGIGETLQHGIDLEQFRDAVKRARDGMWSGCPDTYQQDVPVLDRLLALIDGQAKRSHALDAWTDEQCAEFLAVAMRHVQVKGTLSMNEIRQGQARANALQPTKGEGVACV